MNEEMGFLHSFVSGRWLSVGLLSDPRGARHWGTSSCHRLVFGRIVDPDHDAVMRIGGKAPGGGPILSVGIECQVRIRFPATSDRQFGSRAESQCERRKWYKVVCSFR
jgi:hypothetical protein